MEKVTSISKEQFQDIEFLRELMSHHEDYDIELFGVNDEGDSVQVSINSDDIVVITDQSNGWVHMNIYCKDGSVESLFDGKWKVLKVCLMLSGDRS